MLAHAEQTRPAVSGGGTFWSALSRRVVVFHLFVSSAILVTVACALATFYAIWRWEDVQARKDLAVAAEGHFFAVQNALDDFLSKLSALRALFEASSHVSRTEFATFTERILQHGSEGQNLSWVPRIKNEERLEHERAAVLDGIPGYRIKAAMPDRRIVPSEERAEYLPILYASGRPGDSPIYGIDLRSQAIFREKLDAARDNDQLSVVPDFILHSLDGNIHAFVFSLPVYDHEQLSAPRTVEERRSDLLGFVHGTFQIRAATEYALKAATTARGLDLYIFAAQAGADSLPLYRHSSRLRASAVGERTLGEILGKRHVRGKLTAGDASWIMLAVPFAGGPMAVDHSRAWSALIAGLLVAVIVALYLIVSVWHARKLSSANATISDLARTDPLTGLLNRRAFTESLDAAIAACRNGAPPFAVLYFDLDHFKDVNDTCGHQIGDLLLEEAANRIRAVIRHNDILARFGGDEFALLHFDSDRDAAATLASRINDVLALPFVIAGNEVQISASIGIAEYSDGIATSDALLMQVDLALYCGKEEGRNCYRFHSRQLDQAVNERVTVAAELRRAIKCGDLRLCYQPQVELASGFIIGVEALVRWQHPQRGLVGPADFISIAERTGCIIPLGEWVLSEACRQMKVWRTLGIGPQFVAVNCSAAQFQVGYSMERYLSSVLWKCGLVPSDVEIELTESVLMGVTQRNNRLLEGIRDLGVGIAIDDFGTGYSSLSYLAHYPVSRLKIAQELVFGATRDIRYATVVRAAIQLAAELGAECIAEGVETQEQADFLSAAGCEAAQGYFFGRPVSADEMSSRLQAQMSQRALTALARQRSLGPEQPLASAVA